MGRAQLFIFFAMLLHENRLAVLLNKLLITGTARLASSTWTTGSL